MADNDNDSSTFKNMVQTLTTAFVTGLGHISDRLTAVDHSADVIKERPKVVTFSKDQQASTPAGKENSPRRKV